ncbi:MAG: exonuclease domain-containing protein [Erysipelotrichaceae bacterium]
MRFNINIKYGNIKVSDIIKKERTEKGKSLTDLLDCYTIFDVETTGLDTFFDEIIEIGAIKVKNNKIVSKYQSLVKPNREIDEFITDLTGISNEMVKNAPTIEKILPKLLEFIGNDILIGHNVNFDINFVYDNLYRKGLVVLKNDFIDTMRIARKLLPELSHHRLIDLAEYFSINAFGNHRAIKDCEILFYIYENLKVLALERYGDIDSFKASFKRKHKNGSSRAKDITTKNTEFDVNNLFYKKYVAITGTLEKMLRKDAMQIVVDLGGYCEDNVTKKTNYLILGNNDYNPILKGKKSLKQKKAEKYKLEGKDIEIISENVFYDIVEDYLKT